MPKSYASSPSLWLPERTLGRRRFVEGLAAGGLLLAASPWSRPAWSQAAPTAMGTPPVHRVRSDHL
jgi:hypothetical protein